MNSLRFNLCPKNYSFLLTKVVATDAGNCAAVIEKAATKAEVEPKDSVIRSIKESVINQV